MLSTFKRTKINIWKFIIIAGVLGVADWGIMTANGDSVISLFNFTFLAVAALISLTIIL